LRKLKLKRKRLPQKRKRLRKNLLSRRPSKLLPKKPQLKLLNSKKKPRRQLLTGKSRLRKQKLRLLKRWPLLRS
jgi:hypothetical protein